ncbi:SMP-30/gluconolactonase/LRE family protein [Paenibacillus hamazuiensis]|uniref:SMP-30/gluconolactonase/LRE family protein n=1 Tax=Paenibacillus hamazuiensis TaxID=2936508 RepID=UPI00200C24A2|nr:SMP-30/gluconolactonase/LRE family protein [Paenibacillus hamazuiensis]
MEQVQLLIDAKAALGEGPCWDPVSGRLYWVDILGKRLHIYDPRSQTDRVIQLDQEVGAVVPRAQGGVVLALRRGFYALNLDNESLEAIAEPEPDKPNNRFNDGKCDAKGRFWAGTMDMQEKPGAGKLYRLDPDGTVHTMIDGVTTSNGLVWSPDRQTMYYIDSPTKQVVAYDYNEESGQIFGKRTVVTLSEGEGVPDGMTIDEEGMLWVAQWDGHKVSRWDPATGERLSYIELPAARVSSCTFGGDQWDELYITTARVGHDEAFLQRYPYAGGVFRVKPGVRGLPTQSYGG